jgi:transcriptional regulator with GAF, ATPase, and Fis domain
VDGVFKLESWFNPAFEQPAALPGSIISLEENERSHILRALEATDWRVSGEKGAAQILRINAQTLTSRMKKLGIQRKGGQKVAL